MVPVTVLVHANYDGKIQKFKQNVNAKWLGIVISVVRRLIHWKCGAIEKEDVVDK